MPLPAVHRVVAVGIAGPSGAGKTTLARRIQAALPRYAPVLMAQDSYYTGLPRGCPPEQYNFDAPSAVDLERMACDLMLLKAGEPARIPVYDFARHAREGRTAEVPPAPLVIAEGLHLFLQPALRALLDVKVYLLAGLDDCLRRRLERDTRERGRSAADVIRQFHDQVEPMRRLHVHPTRRFADHLLSLPAPGTARYAAVLARLCRDIEARLASEVVP